MPEQASLPWFSIVPVAESRSSYNGLLVFVFIAISATLAAEVIHRFASRAVRRGPAWDCGYPDPRPATQYTADSFAQPLRRVFAGVFLARERVEMPPPGDERPARIEIRLRDLVWDVIYAPISGWVAFASERMNTLQFLSIRQYLSLVFAALVGLCARGGGMDLILRLAVQGVEMLLVLILAPLLLGFTRKVKARLLRRRGPPGPPALSGSAAADPQGGRARRECVVALS